MPVNFNSLDAYSLDEVPISPCLHLLHQPGKDIQMGALGGQKSQQILDFTIANLLTMVSRLLNPSALGLLATHFQVSR